MIKSYLLIAIRNMWKRKTFTLIHILGLSIAFGAAMVLFMTAMFDLSFDNFHVNSDNIYQVYREQYTHDGIEKDAPMPVPLGPAALAEITGIKHIARFGGSGGSVRSGEKLLDVSVHYTDPSFLQIFSFPLLSGNTGSALGSPDGVIITNSYAKNLFGTADVIGKRIEIRTDNEWKPFIISAVMKDQPKNSSFSFDILSRFENFPGYSANKDIWQNHNHPVFLQLKDGVSPQTFERSATPFIKKYFAENIKSLKRDGAKPDERGNYMNLKLLPLKDIHFSSISNIGPTVNPFFPWILILLSVVILFIAGSNFVNLSLAASFTRAREIGVRKTFGVLKSQLIVQFWSEALVICFISLLMGFVLVLSGLKSFSAFTGNKFSIQALLTPQFSLIFILIFLFTTLLAGGYPSWVMANFNTIRILQGKLNIGSKNSLRNMLTVIQFLIAVVLITATFVITKQLSFIRNKPLGFNKTQVISIPIGSNIDPESAVIQMRAKMAAYPNAVSISASDMNFGRGRDGSASTSIQTFDYKNRELKTNLARVDYDYLKTLDIPLIEGRDFSREFGTDTAAVLINEKMAAQLGEKNPVGKILPMGIEQGMKIIGVVKDFNFKNLHQEIKPLTMVSRADWPVSYIFIKVKAEDLPGSIAHIQKIWKEIDPQNMTEASFLDENTDREYKKEDRLSKIFTAGAGLAIFISCMGLFASALLSMNQRTKEIGIRKVLGASVAAIVTLLSKDFAKLVAIAFLIGAPVTWFIMNKWLEDFAYHISISGWILLSGGLIVLTVALLTVSIHAVKAALANPVKSLRSE